MIFQNSIRSQQRGFTLLETLIAVGIFAFAGMGLLIALQSTLDAAQIIQQESSVRTQLQNRIARLSVGKLQAFHAEAQEAGVKYREEIVPEGIRGDQGEVLNGFWRIKVTAEWKDNGPQTWEISHLALQP